MVCPFEAQLELAGRADAIVADYNYVFEPGVALRRLEPEEWATPCCWWTKRTICPTAPARYFRPSCWRKRCAPSQDSLLLQSGELFESISETIASLMALLAETADGAGRRFRHRRNRAARRCLARAVEGMGAGIHPLPFVETRAETGAAGGSDCRFAFRLAAVHRHFESVRPRLYLRDRKAEPVPSSGHRLPGPGAGLGPHFSRGLFDRFVFGHPFARGNDAPRAGPGKGTHAARFPCRRRFRGNIAR